MTMYGPAGFSLPRSPVLATGVVAGAGAGWLEVLVSVDELPQETTKNEIARSESAVVSFNFRFLLFRSIGQRGNANAGNAEIRKKEEPDWAIDREESLEEEDRTPN